MSGKCRQVLLAFKQEVVEYIEEKKCTAHAAYLYFSRVKNMHYDKSNYYQWYKNKDKIMDMTKNKKRCKGAGRPTILQGLEDILFDQIVEMRLRKMKVMRTLVRGLAAKLADEKGVKDFKASSGFMKWYKLSLCRMTNLTTPTDEKLIERSVSYMLFLRRTLETTQLDRTLSMDETAIYFEDCRTQTIDFEG